MLKLEFKNASVRDSGYGLVINGKGLEELISIALGTKTGKMRAVNSSELPEFNSTCCNVTVIIDPQPVTTCITDDAYEYDSVEALEETRYEQYSEKTKETDAEE